MQLYVMLMYLLTCVATASFMIGYTVWFYRIRTYIEGNLYFIASNYNLPEQERAMYDRMVGIGKELKISQNKIDLYMFLFIGTYNLHYWQLGISLS